MAAGALVLAGYLALSVALVGVGLLLVHAPFLSGVRGVDDSVSQWLADHRSPALDGWVLAMGRVADTVPVVAAAAAVCVALAMRRWWAQIALLAVGLPLELFVFLTANYVVARPRPSVPKLGDQPGTYSYPSGHIAATIVLWGGVALLLVWHHRGRRWLRRVATCVVVVAAVLVGFSRIYRGMHHLSDVVAGAVLGVVVLAIAGTVVGMLSSSPPPAEPPS